VRRAAAEISGEAYMSPLLRWATPVMVTAGVALITFGAWSLYTKQAHVPEPIIAQAAPIVSAAIAEPVAEPVIEPLAEEPEPETTLNEQLRLAMDLTSIETALATLLELWGLDSSIAGNACNRILAAGYECLGQRGSWNSRRQLDRPAILTLTDGQGDAHRVVLTAIHGDRAELSIAGVSVSHSLDAVSELWFGQYLLIWKPANGVSVALVPGTQDPTVTWLRQSLATIDERYRAAPLASDVSDRRLGDRVREFQREHRLIVDGLAGRQTQIIINSLLAVEDVPHLTTPRLAQD